MRHLARHGKRIKVPIYVQGGIHGNEYEGVDAAIDTIEKFATTPRGQDATIDGIRDRAVLVFNPIQNPDGRVAGTRANGNGFDLNRDFLTQSQSETQDVDHADEALAAAGDARPARLRVADAGRGDDQAAQPEHRVRPVAEVESAADRLQRGRHGRHRPRHHAADQRLVPRGGPEPRRNLRQRRHARPRRRRGLGRLGSVLRPDVHAARGPGLLHRRDVLRDLGDPSRGRVVPAVRRPRRCAARAERHPAVDVRVRGRQPRRHAPRRARDVPPR